MIKLARKLLYNSRLNRKFLIVYICCVIIPLVATDSLIFYGLLTAEANNRENERVNEAIAYQNIIISAMEYDSIIARAASKNSSLNEFLDRRYPRPIDFYDAYSNYISSSFFNTLSGLKSDNITVYADNPTLRNGGFFQQLSKAENSQWYKRYLESGKEETLLVFYDDNDNIRRDKRKKIIYVKRLTDYETESKTSKIITIENDYYRMAQSLKDLSAVCPMYICVDDFCVFSSEGDNIPYSEVVERYTNETRYLTERSFTYRGTEFKIYIFSDDYNLYTVIKERIWIILLLLVFTILFPILIMKVIERSITGRISVLKSAFDGDESGSFKPINSIVGSDEIASLMENYNRIVSINNHLIQTVYKDRLREQESDIARKNAELLALQSQINPHFLFNALESIRMHSVLKGEDETAAMVEKLAVMERQNVEWEHDSVTIKKEMEFVRAYLALQNYRFGERLSFDIDIDEGCENILIPKLTLTTFVENACVHGIESKSSQGWIFVRVYKNADNLCIEIEDTGDGMEENEVEALSRSINSIDIETIKTKKRVGILNACLRIKMMFDNAVRFVIESEKGIGFSVVIYIALDKINEQ